MGDKSPKSNAKARRQKADRKQQATAAKQGPGGEQTAKLTPVAPLRTLSNRTAPR